jgi:hypothetical protein
MLRVVAIAVVVVAFGASASAALAREPMINIVSQGEPPEEIPANTKYFKTIQAAVNASKKGDWVLIESGVYDEEVLITSANAGVKVRGMNRNEVILDGKSEPAPGGSTGIEIYKANNVSVENLTIRNFENEEPNGPKGNGIYWNGGDGSGAIGLRNWHGAYLTAYDTGLNGSYGIFTGNAVKGSYEHIYASGYADSGLYIGACPNCQATVKDAVMENNALGYSGSNSGGHLVFENTVFNHNSVGFAPNSENPGDAPPPQYGGCKKVYTTTPDIKNTKITHCTIIRNSKFEDNNNLSTPVNSSAGAAPAGVGIELPGDYADLFEHNEIKNNPNVGVFGFEYPNPFPPQGNTIYFQFAGNKISENTFAGNGTTVRGMSGDISFQGGIFGSYSINNCASGNSLAPSATHPYNLEGVWGCQNNTTPNPNNGYAAIEYILELQAESQSRTSVPQPAPPAQETMPDPCEGVPTNPLCP